MRVTAMWSVGKRAKVAEYATVEGAVVAHNAARDAIGKGASRWVGWTLYIDGVRHYISYNGKVWAGRGCDWTPDAVPVFDPYAMVTA